MDHVRQNALVACIYDAHEMLISAELFEVSQEELAQRLGYHWDHFSLDELVEENFLLKEGDFARMTSEAELLLFEAAGVGPQAEQAQKAQEENIKETLALVAEVQELLGEKASPTNPAALVRVLPMEDFPSKGPVAIDFTHQDPEEEFTVLAKMGLELLAMGNFEIVFKPRDTFFKPAIFVYAKPGKKPSTAMSLAHAIEVLKGEAVLEQENK